jgi:pimeloyl-ACP methyl ester carboxylesterase
VPSIAESTIKIDRLEWFYRHQQPEGKERPQTVVCLHGIPSQSLSWTGIMPPLAARGWRSIAPDWIGCGSSSKPERADFNYTPAAYIQALGDLLDGLNLDRINLVVQGFLGSVGIQYAIANPDRIAKLAILNAPVAVGTKLPWKLKQMALPLAGEMLTQDPLAIDRTLEAGCKLVIENEFLRVYRQPWLKSSDAGRSLLTILRNLQLNTAVAEIAEGLPKLAIPVQIIWGANDPWLPLAAAQSLAASLQQGEIVTLPTAAHYPQEHWYPQIAEALIPFLLSRN